MHFSVTKEVGWEADDESEDPKPSLGVKKRYRFVFDFSRRSSKAKANNNSKGDDGDHVDFNEKDGNAHSHEHHCYSCDVIRSDQYHEDYPHRPGKTPRPSLCTQCRFYRKARLVNRARDGSNRRWVTKYEARVDEREWCTHCGTLRSNKYHEKLLSGELPPWNEVCGQCVINAEKKNKRAQLKVYYQEPDMADWSDDDKHDPLRDSLMHPRSSPYAFTPTSSREEVKTVSASTSASDFQTRAENPKDSDRGEQPPAKMTAHESASGASAKMSKAAERPRANIWKVTVENHVSEDDRMHVRMERQVRQETRETQQPQQQEKGGKPAEQPNVKPQTFASTTAPISQPATSDNTKLREQPKPQRSEKAHETREQTNKTQSHEVPGAAVASANLNDIKLSQEGRELRDYFKPPQPEKRYESRSQPKTMPRESREKPALAPAPAPATATAAADTKQGQEPQERLGYFKLPQQQKHFMPHGQPTMTAASKQQKQHQESREPRERPYTRPGNGHGNGHRKRLSASSTKSTQLPPAEHVYFKYSPPSNEDDAAQQAHKKKKPFFFTSSHESQPTLPRPKQPQFQPKPQPQAKAEAPRPMGVSDMYWASEHGQAEQTFSATAGGFFFPGGAAHAFGGPAATAAAGAAAGVNGVNGTNGFGKSGAAAGSRSSSGSGSGPRSFRQHAAAAGASNGNTNTTTAQIWEVDSDEADEIEQGHAKLVAAAAKSKGKNKSKTKSMMGKGGHHYARARKA
ncbi:hypothetical protein C8A01DRAFT_44863 [Parachaetomium inaequale]|uniref:Uncharacterized protein n=1 Tax=Parachaetomium inaequale TaxID=2588326 RepID=A0AAN6PL77_9PEZI|nr:hypothetical protein C8A01DRAFT_44863 [Parachaetomium inaequale]